MNTFKPCTRETGPGGLGHGRYSLDYTARPPFPAPPQKGKVKLDLRFRNISREFTVLEAEHLDASYFPLVLEKEKKINHVHIKNFICCAEEHLSQKGGGLGPSLTGLHNAHTRAPRSTNRGTTRMRSPARYIFGV